MFKPSHKKLVVIIGPESTGTRIFTEILSQHPRILGTSNALQHVDVLDNVWNHLEDNNTEKASHEFPVHDDVDCILTRRSLPHARSAYESARFLEFPDLHKLRQLSLDKNMQLVLLITSRSTAANLASWTKNRASVSQSIEKAKEQYQKAYLHIFDFIRQTSTPFFLLSFESLLLDGGDYIQSVFGLLGLEHSPVEFNANKDVNKERYEWFFDQGNKNMC